jgi:vanillate O-demethylase ferredoxin subunit
MTEALRRVRIIRRRDETPDIASFVLAAKEEEPLPSFAAGAHIDVEIRPGLVRQYSLSALPDARGHYHIGVLRDASSRGGSLAMHQLRVGDEVRISAPKNHFGLVRGAAMTLLLAGGIGLTPLLAMARQLKADGAAFELHYCARSLAQAAFLDQLATFEDRAVLHFDDGPETNKLDIDGVLSRHPGAHVYVCGPAGFMNWIFDGAERLGFDPTRLHREVFAPGPIEPRDGFGSFQVRLARSGRTIEVSAEQSIARALMDKGLSIPTSCESGVCGTCLTTVLEGVPDHRDFYLSKAEKARGDQMLLCCSRSKSPLLTLDL